MKLYYSPGACSLSPHIALREAGLPVTLVKVSTKTHQLDDGTDYYVSATKLFLGQSTIVNVTLRETKANQYGILGFGGDKSREEARRTAYSGGSLTRAQYRLDIGPDRMQDRRQAA